MMISGPVILSAALLAPFLSQPGGPFDRVGGPGRILAEPGRVVSVSEVRRGADGLDRVAYLYGGDAYYARRIGRQPGAPWRHERIPGTGRASGPVSLDVDADDQARVSFEAADGGPGWVSAVRERMGMWSVKVGGAPAQYAPIGEDKEDKGLAGRLGAKIGAALLTVLILRLSVLVSRSKARRSLRREAALIGRGECQDVIVRRHGLTSAAAGLLLLHPRAAVLFVHGMRPGELWLEAGWALAIRRPGWIEARCGNTAVELAPEPGFWPRAGERAASELLSALVSCRRARGRKPQ